MDLKSNLGGGVSIQPGENQSGDGTVNGDWVDCGLLSGPEVFADVALGAITGSPTAVSVVYELQQADDNSGTNAEDCPVKTDVTLDAAKESGIVRAQRSRRWCRVSAAVAFTGGSSPTVDLGGTVRGQLREVG